MKKSLLFGYALGIILYFLSFITGFAAISISPLKYELTVKQGENSTQTVKITNESPETITLYSSSEDFITSGETGQPQFVKPEDQESSDLSLANWIELNEKNITLAPSETKEVAFTIKVPQN